MANIKKMVKQHQALTKCERLVLFLVLLSMKNLESIFLQQVKQLDKRLSKNYNNRIKFKVSEVRDSENGRCPKTGNKGKGRVHFYGYNLGLLR